MSTHLQIHIHTSIKQTIAPLVPVVSVAEIKEQAKITISAEDNLIALMIQAAIKKVERDLSRAFINTTYTMKLDSFPTCIRPLVSPLVSVTSIKFLDQDEVEQTITASDYRVDIFSEPGRITEDSSFTWPTIALITNAVEVLFVAGYGTVTDDVPEDIKSIIKLLVAHWLENREAFNPDNSPNDVPEAYNSLIWGNRILSIH